MTIRTRLALAAALFAFALPPAAQAEDGAWKVGSTYVVRFDKLDLSRPADRQILLAQVERSATKLCEGVRTKAKRQSCKDEAIKTSLAKAPDLDTAIQLARLERDGVQQAQR